MFRNKPAIRDPKLREALGYNKADIVAAIVIGVPLFVFSVPLTAFALMVGMASPPQDAAASPWQQEPLFSKFKKAKESLALALEGKAIQDQTAAIIESQPSIAEPFEAKVQWDNKGRKASFWVDDAHPAMPGECDRPSAASGNQAIYTAKISVFMPSKNTWGNWFRYNICYTPKRDGTTQVFNVQTLKNG